MQPSMQQLENPVPAAIGLLQKKIIPLKRLCFFLLFCTLLICSACSESPEQIHQRLDTEAKQYIADKQYPQAISTWNRLLTLQPEAADIYPNLAKAYLHNGRYSQALQAFQQHLTRHPESRETRVNIMKIQLRLFDTAGALASWEQIKPFPADPTSLILHGDLLVTLNQYQPAIKEYKKSLTINPTNQTALARLAVTLLGQNATQEAEIFYHRLEALNPGAPEILLQMGNYQLLKGDTETAALFLKRAINLNPTSQKLRLKLAELYINSNQFPMAAAIFKHLLNTAPQKRFYKKMLFESLLLSAQPDEVKSLVLQLSAAENQDVDFLILKGKYYLNTGKYFLAVSQLEIALEKEPRSPLTLYLLAISHLSSGQKNLGQEYLIKSLTLNPNFTAAELTLADYYYKINKYDLALQHVSQVQKKEPENFRSFLIQGNILLAQGKYNAALKALQKVYLLNPESQAPVYSSGVLSSLAEKPERALSLYRTLLAKRPLLADATLLYTQLLCKQGHNDKAINYLKKTVKAHPASPYLHHISGLILLEAEKKQEAIQSFNTALKLEPNLKESYLQLFKLYRDSPDKLEKILLTATNKINNFEEAQINLANLYHATNKPQKAITLLQQALTCNPTSPVLANNLAWLYLQHQPDNLDETMRLASLAYDNFPNNAAVADTLGWVYYKKQLPIRAGWLLEEATALEPNNPQILYHLAIVQMELDKKTLALANFLKAQKNTKDSQLFHTIGTQLQRFTAETP